MPSPHLPYTAALEIRRAVAVEDEGAMSVRNWAILGVFLLAGCQKAEVAPPAPAPVVADFSHDIVARGLNPAWGMTIRGTQIVIVQPAQPDIALKPPGAVIQPDRAVWTAPMADGQSATVTLYLSPCSDGISDKVYPFAAEVRLPGDRGLLGGCAEPAPKPQR